MASLGIWVACGTRHELAELNGMAHMLEHMAFKGTRTRSARAIAEEIENVGGSLNAYTGREITAYHASVLKEDVALGVEMVADILRNSVFDPDELQRERGVILQEIGQALDTPDDLIFDQFQETALPDQPLGRPVLGTAEFGRDDRPRRSLRLPGAPLHGLEHGDVGGRPGSSTTRSSSWRRSISARCRARRRTPQMPEPINYVGGDGRESRTLEQAHLVLGCQGIGYRDPDYYATAIYSTLFGGGMSSRLFQRIREERGLVYGIHCFNAAYADGGLFGIYAGTGEDDLAELVPAVCEEFAGVADTLTEQELIRARNQIKAGTLMALESSGARCEQAARHLLIHNRPIPYEEVVARIEAVDQDAVRRVARRLLQGKLTIAALGPIDELESIDKIAARLAA